MGVLALMIPWELVSPRREATIPRRSRWPANFGVAALDTLVPRLFFPAGVMAAAIRVESQAWGLLPQVGLTGWPAVAAGVVLLDLAIYLQHVLFHAVPALWRLHRMHHADLHCDVTTGVRFHPLETLLSLVWKLAMVAAIGAPVVAVLIFEVLLNATAMFTHGNVRMPAVVDRWLRWLIVTPDMHRVHHSILPTETNSNFASIFSGWDRLLGSYRSAPEAGHAAMTIGLAQFRDPRELRLQRMLLQPFRDSADSEPPTSQ